MRLWLISQKSNKGDAAVVVAPDRETAQNMNPSNGQPVDWTDDPRYSAWAKKLEDVSVVCLCGEIVERPQGVICASFNAG